MTTSAGRPRLGQIPARVEPPEATSDAALMTQVRAGHTEAWEELVRRYQRLVYSVALRSGLPPEDAIDVTQDTFLIFLESSSTMRSDESVASWLMTVARRQSWRVRQRAKREIPVAGVAVDDEPGDLDWDQIASVHDALSKMGHPCRDLLLALYFDPAEPTYSAIAHRMGRSIGGIGPLRARCLKRLHELLEGIGWN